MRVVVTRPLPEAERTAAALRSRGHDVLVAPLMHIETIAADLAGEFAAVVITSANAIRGLTPAQREKLTSLPMFVVGARTAKAARAAGFSNVISADGDGGDLAELVARQCKGETVLYLAGADRAFDLEEELRRMGVTANTVVVYRAVTVPYPAALTNALRIGAVDAVLHFSKRSAENYVAGSHAAAIELSQMHACLSAQVAAPLLAAGASDVRVASRPDEAALLELIESV
jgi:uroporphyrinogen-III synthase